MFEKISALVDLFRKGGKVSNTTAWKQGGITTAAVAAFLLAADTALRAFGYDLPITADQAKNVGGGIIAVVGVVLPVISSASIGILPQKPQPQLIEVPLPKEKTMNFLLLISTVASSVKSIEALMPASPGADKLNAAIALTESIVGTVQPVLPAVEGLVSTLVAGFNAVGLFTKKAA